MKLYIKFVSGESLQVDNIEDCFYDAITNEWVYEVEKREKFATIKKLYRIPREQILWHKLY